MKLEISGRKKYLNWLAGHLAREHPKTRGKIGKKGFIGDIITVIVSCFFLGIIVLVMVFFVNTFNTAWQGSADIDASVKPMIDESSSHYPGSMDWLMMFALFGLPLVAATFIYFLDFSSIFMWIILLISFLFVLLGGVLSIGWTAIINTASLSSVVASVPMTATVMANYAVYALYVVVVVVASMFFKQRSGVGL